MKRKILAFIILAILPAMAESGGFGNKKWPATLTSCLSTVTGL